MLSSPRVRHQLVLLQWLVLGRDRWNGSDRGWAKLLGVATNNSPPKVSAVGRDAVRGLQSGLPSPRNP